MTDFPKLKTGSVSQYPSERHVQYATRVLSFVGGRQQRWREQAAPGRRWVLRFSNVDESEMGEVVEFFRAQAGRSGHFSFEDPWSGTEYPDCSFDQDTFATTVEAEGRLSAIIAIRENR